jgi:hypothetical protein
MIKKASRSAKERIREVLLHGPGHGEVKNAKCMLIILKTLSPHNNSSRKDKRKNMGSKWEGKVGK